MSVVGSQQRTVLALLQQLRPHWRNDRNLPARIQTLLGRHRSFGSRDRRLYRELIYTTLRYLPWVQTELDRDPENAAKLVAWLAADSPVTKKFRAELISDWPPCPSGVAGKVSVLTTQPPWNEFPNGATLPSPVPEWFRSHCPEIFAAEQQLDALLSRAPLWLRIQTSDIARVTDEFDQLGWRWLASSVLTSAIRLFDDVDVSTTNAHRNGLIEVQDLGSQLVLESAGIVSGGRWLDACAGAGGKTLQLSRLLGPTGHVDAFDVRSSALRELEARAVRARLPNVTILHGRPDNIYDGVLVDAPCSGSGTWRRAPHLKWTTTQEQIHAAAARQRELLDAFSGHVRPGGRLVYATCSLSHFENEDVVADFLAAHPEFAAERPARDFGATFRGGGLTFLPALHDSDGFFVAALRRSTTAVRIS